MTAPPLIGSSLRHGHLGDRYKSRVRVASTARSTSCCTTSYFMAASTESRQRFSCTYVSVIIEAFAALLAQPAGVDHFAQQHGWAVLAVAGFAV